jgi:hypothetical protein
MAQVRHRQIINDSAAFSQLQGNMCFCTERIAAYQNGIRCAAFNVHSSTSDATEEFIA